LYYYFGGKIGL